MDPGTATLAASAIGAGASAYGASQANTASKEAMGHMIIANAQEAQRNRDFQHWYRATSHAVETADLVNAGLNPILSANSGSGGTGGSAASFGSAPSFQNELEGIGAAAQQMATLKLQLQKQQKELELMEAQKQKTNMETRGLKTEATKGDIVEKIFESGSNAAKDLFKRNPKEFKVPEAGTWEPGGKVNLPNKK